jgi:hypothetical protein
VSGLARRIRRAQEEAAELSPPPPPLVERYIPADTKTCTTCGCVLVANRQPAPPDRVPGGTVWVCACGRWYCGRDGQAAIARPKLRIAKVCSCGAEELR